MYIFSIHPRYKHDVGYRLSRSGLAIAYGQQVEFQGPIVQNVAYSSGAQTITVTYTAVSGIELRNPAGFEVRTVLVLKSQFLRKTDGDDRVTFPNLLIFQYMVKGSEVSIP